MLVIILLLIVPSCAIDRNEYSEFKDIPIDGWKYDDTLIFTPQLNDSVAIGVLEIALRHNNDYLYSNLWLEVSYCTAIDSMIAVVDTLNIELADIYGKWHGSGSGMLYQLSDSIATECSLKSGVPIKVRHIMRDDNLTGIEQVGITFTPNFISFFCFIS